MLRAFSFCSSDIFLSHLPDIAGPASKVSIVLEVPIAVIVDVRAS